MKARITTTTDGKFQGQLVETNLTHLTLASGDSILFTGRLHRGNGQWRLWNSNYVVELTEVPPDDVQE